MGQTKKSGWCRLAIDYGSAGTETGMTVEEDTEVFGACDLTDTVRMPGSAMGALLAA